MGKEEERGEEEREEACGKGRRKDVLRIVGEECGKRVIRNEGISLLAGDLFSSSRCKRQNIPAKILNSF